MKKLILIVLAAALTLTLCACEAKKDALTTAQEMIGEDISSLTAAIGEPDNSSYASSASARARTVNFIMTALPSTPTGIPTAQRTSTT